MEGEIFGISRMAIKVSLLGDSGVQVDQVADDMVSWLKGYRKGTIIGSFALSFAGSYSKRS